MKDHEKSIFISYRREDSSYAAGRLYDRLSLHFGKERIFMDIDTIGLGVDFVHQIETAVGACDVLLAIIGPRWLMTVDAEGKRRLDNPNDFVRLEISAALKRNIHVIPVLVDDATMPPLSELPDVLEGLERRNGIEISHSRFDADARRLIRGIETIFATISEEMKIPSPELPVVEAEEVIQEPVAKPIEEPVEKPTVKPAYSFQEKIDHRDLQPEARVEAPVAEADRYKLRQFVIYLMVGYVIGGFLRSLALGLMYEWLGIEITAFVFSGLIFSIIVGAVIGIALRKVVPRVKINQIFLIIVFFVAGGLFGDIFWGSVSQSFTDPGSMNYALYAVVSLVTSLLTGVVAGFGIGLALKQVVLNFDWLRVRRIMVAWILGSLLGGFLIGFTFDLVNNSIMIYVNETYGTSSFPPLILFIITGLLSSLSIGFIIAFIGGRAILSEVGGADNQ